MDELQNQLLEWQENVPESEESRDQVREEKSAMALRMAQIEEEREGEFYFQYNNPVFIDTCVSAVLQTKLIAHHHDSFL